jgi:hypothetical protein
LFPYIFSPLVTIPVAPMIAGMTKHFMFHIRWISILKFLYFNFFSDSCITFLSDGIATSVSKQILSFLFFIIITLSYGLSVNEPGSNLVPLAHYIVASERYMRWMKCSMDSSVKMCAVPSTAVFCISMQKCLVRYVF